MAKIVGNDNDFPTIKQVNDALSVINTCVNILVNDSAIEFVRKVYITNVKLMSTTLDCEVLFNNYTNTFIYKVTQNGTITYYNGYKNQTTYGTPTIDGTIPFDNKIYKETSTGKYYIYQSGTLVELDIN